MNKIKLANRKGARLMLTGAAVALSTVLGFNCAPFGSKTLLGSAGISSSEGGGGGGSQQSAQITTALLSSEQMLKAMIAATGTEDSAQPTVDDNLINTTFDARSGSLPSDQNLTLITGPMLISVTNLASAVCGKMVNREIATGEAQRETRLFFRELDFSKGLSMQSSDSISLGFERLAKNAWRRDPSVDETNSIISYSQEFVADGNANDPVQTRLLAVSVCTAILSSIDALTY